MESSKSGRKHREGSRKQSNNLGRGRGSEQDWSYTFEGVGTICSISAKKVDFHCFKQYISEVSITALLGIVTITDMVDAL